MTIIDPPHGAHRFCVAPMLDLTDRHCRYFHRQLSRRARLYTEMVSTGALLHGPRERLLAFDAAEHPLALQLGGSEPADLAQAARLGERAGYDEINLNCGCPSERVQRGAFGACLMAEPALVADCVRAMRAAVSVPVTVKHRIGLDRIEDYGFVRDFVGTVAQAGCAVFIVHARNAWLKGLSPRDNRTVPPLRYDIAARLKSDFPELTIVLNGGLREHASALAQLERVDGVMIGREAANRSSTRCARTCSARRPPACRCARWCGTCSACSTVCRARAAGVARSAMRVCWRARVRRCSIWRCRRCARRLARRAHIQQDARECERGQAGFDDRQRDARTAIGGRAHQALGEIDQHQHRPPLKSANPAAHQRGQRERERHHLQRQCPSAGSQRREPQFPGETECDQRDERADHQSTQGRKRHERRL